MSLEVAPSIQLLVLHRVDTDQNMHRYYVLSVAPTLFEDIALVREWGRIGRSTRRDIELHADQVRAGEWLQTWLRRKAKRGYVVAHQALASPDGPSEGSEASQPPLLLISIES